MRQEMALTSTSTEVLYGLAENVVDDNRCPNLELQIFSSYTTQM